MNSSSSGQGARLKVSDQGKKKKKNFLREYFFFFNEHGIFQSLLPFTFATIKKKNKTKRIFLRFIGVL